MNDIALTRHTIQTLIDLQHRAVELIPERLRILFNESTYELEKLDVHDLYPYSQPGKAVINFSRFRQESKNIMQLFARLEIFIGKAPSTVQEHLDTLLYFFEEAGKIDIYDYLFLTIDEVKSFLTNHNYSANQSYKVCNALKCFYLILESLAAKKAVTMDIKELDTMIRKYTSMVKATQNAHKTPSIDEEYFDALKIELPRIIWNNQIPINYRMTAALIMLEMYTGLRPSELYTLKTTSKVTRTTNKGKSIDYLIYGVPKLSHGGRVAKYAECYMLPGAVTAFENLMTLRQQIPGHESTDLLFIFDNNLPTKSKNLSYYSDRLFMGYLKHLSTDYTWASVKVRNIGGKKYRIPSMTQFRVHLCSYLYYEGIPMHIVELCMSHMSSSMEAYYVRHKDKIFEGEQDKANKILGPLLGNDYDLSGNNSESEKVLDEIIHMLMKYRYTVTKLQEAKDKDWGILIAKYDSQLRDIRSTGLRPALKYLHTKMEKESTESILVRHPSLTKIIGNIHKIEEEIDYDNR